MRSSRPSALGKSVPTLAAELPGHGIPYAFGGAVAQAFWGEPRATADVDVNIFLPEAEALAVFAAFEDFGASIDRDEALVLVREHGCVRVALGNVPVDLFFSYDPFHDECRRRAVTVPILDGEGVVLSAEDLVVFKTINDRNYDIFDVEKIIAVQGPDFDADYALHWLDRILGPADSAVLRLCAMIDDYRRNPA